MPETLLQNSNMKTLGAYTKAVGDAADDAPYGWVEGIANAFEVDRYGDLVLPEAIAGAWLKYSSNPVLSFGHGIEGNPKNGTMPAGSVLKLWLDENGSSNFRARWANTEDAQMTRQLYKDGDMRAFSIHFLPYGDSLVHRAPTSAEVAAHPGVVRVITKLELIEIACAVVPVNAGSLATEAKSLQPGNLAQPKKLLQSHLIGERAMPKSILTSDQRKAIKAAADAHDAHIKAMEDASGTLEELASSKAGAEGDFGGMCMKVYSAYKKSGETHAAFGDSLKAMHKAVTNTDIEGEGEGGDEEVELEGEAGSPPMDDAATEKALTEKFQKALA